MCLVLFLAVERSVKRGYGSSSSPCSQALRYVYLVVALIQIFPPFLQAREINRES